MAQGLVWNKGEQQAQHLESPYFLRGAYTFPGAGVAIGKLQNAAVVSLSSPNGLIYLKDSVSTSFLYCCQSALMAS